jgi:hypothetical protein
LPEVFDDLVLSETVMEALPSSDAVKFKEVIFDRLMDLPFPSNPDAIGLHPKGMKSIHEAFLELPDSPQLRPRAKKYYEVFCPSLLYANPPLIPNQAHLEMLRRLSLRGKDVVSKAAELNALSIERAAQTPIISFGSTWVRDDWFVLLRDSLDLRFYDVGILDFS